MKIFHKTPLNRRIVSENVYAGLFVTFLLGMILPFCIDQIQEYRILFVLAMGVTTTVGGMLLSVFMSYVLPFPLDPSLPLRTVDRNSFVQFLVSIPDLVQCHRAFIVNLNFVVTMSTRNNGYQLTVFGTEKAIPVSRTYTPEVKRRLEVRG